MRLEYESRPAEYMSLAFWRLRYYGAALVLIAVIGRYAPLPEFWAQVLPAIALNCGALIPFFLGYQYWLLRRMGVPMRQTVVLADEGLRLDSPKGEGVYRWGGLHKVDSAYFGVLIYFNSQMAMVVPDRAFASPADRERFLSELRSRMAAAKAA
jgi:hypothetical protein